VCSYRKLKVTVEKRKELCPICAEELYRIEYWGNRHIVKNMGQLVMSGLFGLILRRMACQFGVRSDGGVAVAMKTIDLPKCPFDGKNCERFGACDVSWFEADKPLEQLSRCSRFKDRKPLGEAERK
jgi:hypothetical protein